MKRIVIGTFFALLATTALSPAWAEVKVQPYPSVDAIPAPLLDKLRFGATFEEQYVSAMLLMIRQNAADHKTLSQKDIDNIGQRDTEEARRRQYMEIVRYDLNHDSKVTADEVRAAMEQDDMKRGQNATLVDDNVNRFMHKYDVDGDGAISLKEMSEVPIDETPHGNAKQAMELEALLALGQNGSIGVDALERLARAAFETVDTDHNGVLSPDESNAVRGGRSAYNKVPGTTDQKAAPQPCPGGGTDCPAPGSITGTPDSDVYPDLASIPPVLATLLNNYGQQYEEAYVASVLQVIRNNGGDKATLSAQQIDAMKEHGENDALRNVMGEIAAYDRNFDERVTADEIRETLRERRRGFNAPPSTAESAMIETQVKGIMSRYDLNGDGTITFDEVAQAVLKTGTGGRYGNSAQRFQAYLDLAPNHDGVLTAAQLESLARKAFRTADTDHDGILSPDELKAVSLVARTGASFPLGCVAPPAAADDKVVFVSVTRAGALSDVSLAHNPQTGVVQLDVAPGESKLYVIAQSTMPAIWQVTGAADRISHLVLAGPLAPETMQGMTGAAGVAKDKVAFPGNGGYPGCMLQGAVLRDSSASIAVPGDNSQSAINGAVTKFSGKSPESILVKASASRIAIDDSGKAALEKSADTDDSADLDPDVWKDGRMMAPGGLVRLKGVEVISNASVEPYSVLPGWAGLAQLVHDGALVAEPRPDHATRIIVGGDGEQPFVVSGVGNTVINGTNRTVNIVDEKQFRIVKPLKELPSGIATGGMRFVLAKGVPAPETMTNAPCVVSEETGKPLNENVWACR